MKVSGLCPYFIMISSEFLRGREGKSVRTLGVCVLSKPFCHYPDDNNGKILTVSRKLPKF